MKATSEQPIGLHEVKKILSERAKKGELGYEQQNTLEYAKTFAKLSATNFKKFTKEAGEIGVDEQTAIILADVLPKKEEEVKLICEKIATDEKAVKAILALCKKYAKA